MFAMSLLSSIMDTDYLLPIILAFCTSLFALPIAFSSSFLHCHQCGKSVLDRLHQPNYFDCLTFVFLANLQIPSFDRLIYDTAAEGSEVRHPDNDPAASDTTSGADKTLPVAAIYICIQGETRTYA